MSFLFVIAISIMILCVIFTYIRFRLHCHYYPDEAGTHAKLICIYNTNRGSTALFVYDDTRTIQVPVPKHFFYPKGTTGMLRTYKGFFRDFTPDP